jgi:hypothetical protein
MRLVENVIPVHSARDAFGPALAPDGRSLATAGHSEVVVWDLVSGQATHAFAADQSIYYIAALAFRADGGGLASGRSESQILLWDLAGSGPRADPTPLPTP